MKNLILLLFNMLLFMAVSTNSLAQCSLPSGFNTVINPDGSVTLSWLPGDSFADFLTVNDGQTITVSQGDVSVNIPAADLIPGINTLCLQSFCVLPEGGFNDATTCTNIFIPFDCDPTCSITAGNPQSYCVTGLECIPLNGGTTSGNVLGEVIWSVLNTPIGVSPDQVKFDNPNDATTIACFQDGPWVAGQYTFLLSALCSNECPTAQEVVITIDPEPIFYLGQEGGASVTVLNVLACTEVDLFVTLDNPFLGGAPDGVIPAGSTGVWTWSDVGNLNYEVNVIDDMNINVKARNFDKDQCNDALTVTHTITTPGGCVTSRSTDVTLFAADLGADGNVSNILACIDPNSTTVDLQLNLPFAGCYRTFDTGLVSVTQTEGPLVDEGNFVEVLDEGYLDAMTIENLGVGDYTFLYEVNENPLGSLCEGFVVTYNVRVIFSDIDCVMEPGSTPTNTTCDEIPTEASYSMPESCLDGGTVSWSVGQAESYPGWNPAPASNVANYEVTNIPSDHFFFVTGTVTSPQGCITAQRHYYYPPYLANSEGEVRISCSDEAEDFVRLIDHMDPTYLFDNGEFYCESFGFDCDIATMKIELLSSPTSIQWTSSNYHPSLGFTPAVSGVYQFRINTLISGVDGQPECDGVEFLTIIVGPNGEIARAGTDVTTCEEEIEIVGAELPNDANGLIPCWSVTSVSPSSSPFPTISDINSFNPTVSGLTPGTVYTLEYKIKSIEDPECFTTDDLIITTEDEACECTSFHITEDTDLEIQCDIATVCIYCDGDFEITALSDATILKVRGVSQNQCEDAGGNWDGNDNECELCRQWPMNERCEEGDSWRFELSALELCNNNIILDFQSSGEGAPCGVDIHEDFPISGAYARLIEDETCTKPELINDPKGDKSFKVFPNPAKDQITILSEKETAKHIRILNSNGKEMYSIETKESDINIDVSHMPTGFYFVQVINSETGQNIGVEKLVIQNTTVNKSF